MAMLIMYLRLYKLIMFVVTVCTKQQKAQVHALSTVIGDEQSVEMVYSDDDSVEDVNEDDDEVKHDDVMMTQTA